MIQEKLIKRFEERIRDFKDILAVYYAGSTARKTMDKYSDLDIYLVVSDGDFDAVKSRFVELIGLFGEKINFMFSKDTAIAYVGEEYIKVELNLVRRGDLKVSRELGNIRIFFDKDGGLTKISKESRMSKQEVRDVRSAIRFFSAVRDHYISIARHYARGQKFSSVHRLQMVKSKALSFVAEIKGVEDFELIKGAEKILTKKQYNLMNNMNCGVSKSSFVKGIKSYWDFSKILQEEYEKKVGQKIKLECNDKEIIKLVNGLLK